MPDRPYSTRLRTAVVLTGSGTAGAYQAGVLRALHEAGVRIDLVAGRGVGAVTALFAAVDGASRLWEPDGIWKGGAAAAFYRWRPGLRAAGWALVIAALILSFPIVLFGCAILVGLVGFLLTLVGAERAGSALQVSFTSWLAALFTPGSLPTIVPRLVLLMVLVALACLAASLIARGITLRVPKRTRRRGLRAVWQLVASPLSSAAAADAFSAALWKLIRGAAPLQQPARNELGRRYIELLLENLGQPGFRELLIVVHDVDARQDAVFAVLSEEYRARFFARPPVPLPGDPGAGGSARPAEAFDLAGVAREHAMDAMCASLALPVATEPHLIAFAAEGPWRGERHRLLDRPSALARVLQEAADAGAEQVVLVAASPRAGRPHELRARRADVRAEAAEQLGAFESAELRDAIEQFAGRFAGLYVIRPEHNPIGPLDFAGVHDERSDRRYLLPELVDRGYEDAYRQFIDPVVGASGERIESVGAQEI